MKVNTLVVRALMALRLIDDATLSHTMQIPPGKLHAWLYDEDGEAVAYHRQLEVLSLLGIDDSTPRDDVVHHWTVEEPWFGDTNKVYWALEVMTRAFGRAQVVFVAPETDPALTFKAVARYGLRFNGFYALMEVRCPAVRSLRFNPAIIPGLSWMPGNFGLLLEHDRMGELEPGAMPVEQFADDVSVPTEMLKWERLTNLASKTRISPEDLARWIVNNNPQLGFQNANAVVEEPDEEEAPGEETDALFTEDDEATTEATAGVPTAETGAPTAPAVEAEPLVAAMSDLSREKPVGPTGAPPRRRHPAMRPQANRPR